MMHARQINARNAIFAAAIALWPGSPSFAADAFKATVGQRGNWDTSVCYLGEKAGIFKKHGIEASKSSTLPGPAKRFSR